MLPLQYMLMVMRNPCASPAERFAAAVAAAPYVHARLAHVEQKSTVTASYVVRVPEKAKSNEEWLEKYAPKPLGHY
jgi:hypothetical protein